MIRGLTSKPGKGLIGVQAHKKETETDTSQGKQSGKNPITLTKDKEFVIALR